MKDKTEPRVFLSLGQLTRARTEAREVRAPSAYDLPEEVPLLRDADLGRDVPAVIGVAGAYLGLRTNERGETGHQWVVYVRPMADRVRQRAAGRGVTDQLLAMCEDLTARQPSVGAMFTGYFFGGKRGGAPFLATEIRGGRTAEADPWDDAAREAARDALNLRLDVVCRQLWDSWTKDPGVRMVLAAADVMVAPGRQTMYSPGGADRIRSRLPDEMRRTVFGGARMPEIDGPEDAAPGSPDIAHAATMVVLAVLALVLFAACCWLLFAGAAHLAAWFAENLLSSVPSP